MSFLAFTVTDKPDHPGCVRLKKSADFWGWDLKVVEQEGFERQTYRAEQLGWLKAFDMHPQDSIFLYLDAWDTIFTGPPQELALPKEKLTFSTDFQCFPNPALEDVFPKVLQGEGRYINAGVVWGDMGVAWGLAKEYLALENQLCQQDFFNARYIYEMLLGRDRLQLDTSHRVALSTWGMDPAYSSLYFRNGRTHYKPTGTTPLVLHQAGSTSFHVVPPMPEWENARYL